MALGESTKTGTPASPQSSVSTNLIPPGFVFNILLLSTNSGFEAEIVEVWQEDGKEWGDPYEYALVHYSFERAHDVLVTTHTPKFAAPKGGAPKGGRPKISRSFSLSRPHFRTFSLSLGAFSLNFGGV